MWTNRAPISRHRRARRVDGEGGGLFLLRGVDGGERRDVDDHVDVFDDLAHARGVGDVDPVDVDGDEIVAVLDDARGQILPEHALGACYQPAHENSFLKDDLPQQL